MIIYQAQKENLLDTLSALSGITERKHTIPITTHVLFHKNKDHFQCVTTDTEMQISTSLENHNSDEENFSLTTSVYRLLDFLRSLPDGSKVKVESKDKEGSSENQNKNLRIQSGRSHFNLQSMSGEDFPRLKLSNQITDPITIEQQKLKKIIQMTHYAMAFKEIRYYLNGIHLCIDDQHLISVATDSHRMAYFIHPLFHEGEESKNNFPDINVILPRKAVLELYRLLDDSEEPITIIPCERQIIFQFKNLEFISKLIEGKYPDYQKVIPIDLPNNMIINRHIFLESLSRLNMLTSEKEKAVKIYLDGDQIHLNIVNSMQEEGHEEIEVSVSGEGKFNSGFNINYLMDSLNNVDSEFIKWEYLDQSSSTLITIPDRYDYKYVLMPMLM